MTQMDPAPSGGGERAAAGEEESPGEERALVIHSQAEEQEYKCPLCGERFQQQPSLTRHQKLHAAERAYICPECGKRRFSQKGMLEGHQCSHLPAPTLT
uniref:C2H2-type domain-containing protein n=1 Tax=Crocodylus porosus TaxID=8502 RepID=A0A7M4DZK9_CROPO